MQLTAVVAGVLILAALVGATALLLLVAVTHLPSNHIGYDIRDLWGLSAVGALWALGCWRFELAPRWLRVAITLATAGFAVMILVLDRCNFLVEYGAWIRRGVPGPGCFK